jgi:hypothetical protein
VAKRMRMQMPHTDARAERLDDLPDAMIGLRRSSASCDLA